MKRKPGPVAVSESLALTFRGLDLCDGCGTRLEPGDRLSGLCPVCLGVKATGKRDRQATAWDSVRGRR